MSTPQFWSTPLRYLRWASHERPHFFYPILLACMGPVSLVAIPPIRRALGDVDPEPIPLSYPGKTAGVCSFLRLSLANVCFICLTACFAVPKGPRVIPQGYDD